MKSLVLTAALLASAQSFAFGLESHYGTLSVVNGKHVCTLTNDSGADLDVKRVQFELERRAGKNREVVSSTSYNNVVYAGETVSVASSATQALIGRSCKFLAR